MLVGCLLLPAARGHHHHSALNLRVPPSRSVYHSAPVLRYPQPAIVCSTPSIMQCRGYRPILSLCHSTTRRHSTLPRSALPADFLWFPRFFDLSEQHALLSAALRKLDAVEPTAPRRQRRNYLASRTRGQQPPREVGDPSDVFLPDDIYHFEEVRHLPVTRN